MEINTNENYMNLFEGIYIQAVKDDYNAIRSKILKRLMDMSVSKRDAIAYIKGNEEQMEQIKDIIRHNVYKEAQDYGSGKTRSMQMRSITSFTEQVEQLVTSYRMTNKEKGDRVKRCRNLENSIGRLLEEKERWETKAEKITPVLSGMPQGGDGENQREAAVCNMVDCETEINKLIDQLCDLRKQINHYILTTGDNDERLLVVLMVDE